MTRYAAQTTYAFSANNWPFQHMEVEVIVDTEGDAEMPNGAFEARLSEALTEVARNATFRPVALEEGEFTPGQHEATAENWTIPAGLHMKSAKASHRFLVGIAALSERGPAPTLADVADKAGLSMPPVYRFVDPSNDVGAYLAPLITVSKDGRAKVVDLTPLGRKVASRIRAGSLPS